jgi:two-component system sensor histidine kinase QseC
MRKASLRGRLLMLLLASVAVVGIAAAALAYVDARHEAGELLDAHLVQAAALVLAQARHDEDDNELEHAPELHKFGHRVAYQIWDRAGSLRVRSPQAPDARMSPNEEGFANVDVDGRAWRVYSGWDRKRRLLVQVGERQRGRDEIAVAIARSVVVPFGIALPVLAVLVWLAVTFGLAPLRAIAREVGARAPTRLEPLSARRVPAEIVPLVDALDRLLGRVRASIEGERRFTADAAHELRTPLAALRAQAQVAREATSDAARAHALDGVMAGCDRAARLVDQLLTLARLEPGEPLRGESVDLHAIARDALADAAPAAVAKDIDVALEGAAAVRIQGDAGMLTILLRNLVDNAIRYAPSASAIRVRATKNPDGSATLAVADEGAGVPAAERAKLGERFHRREGVQASGVGLGLSIVRRICELHGATLAFCDGPNGRGLEVRITFAP